MRKIDKHMLIAAGALLALSVVLIGVGSAVLTDGEVAAPDPENETVAVDAEFSGGTTGDPSEDMTVELSRDGTVIRSDTITGQVGAVNTSEVSLTGLSAGPMDLNVTTTDDTNVDLVETRMETTRQTGINIIENDTLLVDVQFDAAETTNATVEIEDETGTVVNTTELSFDPIEAEDGSGIETVEIEASSDLGNVTVHVTTTSIYGYDGVYVSKGSTTGGGGGGAGGGQNLIDWFTGLSPLNKAYVVGGLFSAFSTVAIYWRL
jgi:hypothetical protein